MQFCRSFLKTRFIPFARAAQLNFNAFGKKKKKELTRDRLQIYSLDGFAILVDERPHSGRALASVRL